MKILAINGSPRRGNSELILNIILGAAKEKCAEIELIELRKKSINFCGGGDDCCPITGKCYIKDDMLLIYPLMEEADMIILASPCYFSNVSARMKNFMDRCNPYYFNKRLKGKKFFLIAVGGYKPSIKGTINAMAEFVSAVEGKIIGNYVAVADKKDDLKKKKGVVEELKKIGASLI